MTGQQRRVTPNPPKTVTSRFQYLRIAESGCRNTFLALLFAVGCVAAPVSSYRVVATFPHSTASYTEGLFYLDGFFYEGTGLKGDYCFRKASPPMSIFAVP